MKLIAIGCSWGGLTALSTLLAGLPRQIDGAVVVAQHRGAEDSQLEALLRDRSPLPVREVDDKDPVEPGHVFLAPPAYHLLVQRDGFALSTDAPVQFARPSVDVLFESAAAAYGGDCVGVVLTGTNADGARGLRRIVDAGGAAIVQSPATAERSEMPAAALDAVPVAQVLDLEQIPPAIVRLCATKATA